MLTVCQFCLKSYISAKEAFTLIPTLRSADNVLTVHGKHLMQALPTVFALQCLNDDNISQHDCPLPRSDAYTVTVKLTLMFYGHC